jgi:hypothetical protein
MFKVQDPTWIYDMELFPSILWVAALHKKFWTLMKSNIYIFYVVFFVSRLINNWPTQSHEDLILIFFYEI